MRAIAYIDGFNLYHGALKDRPACKWLDLRPMCERLLPDGHELHRIRYFTARVGGSTTDPGEPQRQDVYLRALSGVERVAVHEDAVKADSFKPIHESLLLESQFQGPTYDREFREVRRPDAWTG